MPPSIMESAPPADPESSPALPADKEAKLNWRAVAQWLRAWSHARFAIVALAAVLRLWQLDLRPPHFDEGVNGWFTDQMQKIGYYSYDPSNYHGPLHFYVLFVFKCLLGRNLWALRLPVALVGIWTVDWIFRFERFFGRRACIWTAMAMAISPAFLFYHRYAIHETWLVFFMILGFWGIIGLRTEGERRYLWATGMGLIGMILTKETYLIHLGCLLAAIPCVLLLEGGIAEQWAGLMQDHSAWAAVTSEPMATRHAPMQLRDRPSPQHWRWSDLAAVAAVGIAAILFFYSGNGFHPKLLEGLVTAFTPWAHKAQEGEGHNKPFYYWFGVLLRNEPWVFAGLVFAFRRAFDPGGFGWPMRLLAIYAIGAATAYSLIPYKTPWCVLAFAWPFLFLAAAELVDAAESSKSSIWGLAAAAGGSLMIYAGTLWIELAKRTSKFSRISEGLLYDDPILLMGLAVPFLTVAAAMFSGANQKARRGLLTAAGAALLAISAFLSIRLSFYRYTDEHENYVYVHTYEQVNKITGPLYDLAREDAVNYHRPGLVLLDSTHPIPWLLGDFTQVKYYMSDRQPPAGFHPDFLIVSQEREAEAEAMLDEDFFKSTFRLRPSLGPITLYLRYSLFAHLMPGREPEFHKDAAAPAETASSPAPPHGDDN